MRTTFSPSTALLPRCLLALLLSCVPFFHTAAQPMGFSLRSVTDSLSVLTLRTDSTLSEWPLPYPVYQFCTGDIDGNGSEDALVGVVKATRVFVFKNYHGLVRPLWMGSRIGGPIEDFRVTGHLLTCLQHTADGRYVVAQYHWDNFGFSLDHFLAKNVTREQAIELFTKTISP